MKRIGVKSRRLRVLIGIGFSIAIIVYTAYRMIPCQLCAAEREIGARLGVDPTLTAIDLYLDRQLVVGQTKEEAFAVIDRIEPYHIEPMTLLGGFETVSGAHCYRAGFEDILAGNRVLNRYLCFDSEGRLVFIEHELGAY